MNYSDHVFLATTALEEFWDTSKPLVLLGEGCARFSRRHVWEKLDHHIVPTPTRSRAELMTRLDYVLGLYERILPQLTDMLNRMHGVSYSMRYWRVVLGPWLHFYLPILYDRYLAICSALEQFPNATTIGLAPASYLHPRDTNEFMLLSYDDPFNLQIYTRILKSLGVDIRVKSATGVNAVYPFDVRPSAISLSRRLFRSVVSIVAQTIFRNSAVIFRDSFFSRIQEGLLVLKTRGRIGINIAEQIELPHCTPNEEMRRQLRNIKLPQGSFENLLADLLPTDVPQCYVESYRSLASTAENLDPEEPKAIFSANAWYYNEPFKFWAAARSERGTLLLAAQHGGGYGVYVDRSGTYHELQIADIFYSWGWTGNSPHARILPMPATKLVGIEIVSKTGRPRHGILLVTMACPRYAFDFLPKVNPAIFVDYLDWHKRFCAELAGDSKKSLRVRLHSEKFGWDLRERWQDHSPEIMLESMDTPFRDSLSDCRLCVIDHLSNTYCEALAANKPTILFWSPDSVLITEDAAPYLAALHDAGVLFYSPEAAAHAVNEVYPRVKSWWAEPERQQAVKRFCHRFGYNCDNALEVWAAEFERVAQTQRGQAG